jgi:hypothetical protein
MPAQVVVSIQTPATPATEHAPPVGGGADPLKSVRAASAWAMRFEASQVPQISKSSWKAASAAATVVAAFSLE